MYHRGAIATCALPLILVCVIPPARAEAGEDVTAQPITRPPAIDGDLSDACWASAVSVAGFTLASSPEPAPKAATVRALFDSEALYLAVDCSDPDMANLRATPRPRDGGAWEDDCLEVFLRPDGDASVYYQFVCNSLGSFDDYRYAPEAIGRPEDWNPEWQVQVRRQADSWQVEMRVPFSQLPAPAPVRGDTWGLKVGREDYPEQRGREPATPALYTWPAGSVYGGAADWGSLVFADRNCLLNADFTEPAEQGFAHWSHTPGDREHFAATTADGVPTLALRAPGRYVWIQQELKLQPDASYHLSAEVKAGAGGWLQATVDQGGDRGVIKYTLRLRTSNDFAPYEIDFPSGPKGAVGVGFGCSGGDQGEILVRHLRVEKAQRNLVPDYMALPQVSPDPIHGLKAFAERQGVKPYERLRELGLDGCERLVFRDTITGTEIWKLTNDSVAEGHDYALWPPYSANGAHMWFRSPRWIDGTTRATMCVMDARGDRIRLLTPWYNLSGWWHPRDGGIYFYILQLADHYELTAVDVRTGESKVLADLPVAMGITLAEPGPWSEWLLVIYPDGFHGKAVRMDGSAANDLTFPYALGETHFSRAHEGVFTSSYSATAEGPGSGNVLLRLTPDGRLDPDFAITDRSNTEYRNFSRGGHGQSSPDETMFARASGTVDMPDGTTKQVILPGLLGGGDYISWQTTPEWFLLETFSEVDKVWADGSNVQRLCFPNSANSTYYSLPWSCSSPDGTKLAFRSTMTGNVEFLQAVVSRPLPPAAVSARAQGDSVTLNWQAPALHKEIAGYYIYRSSESGQGFVQIAPQPVETISFADTTATRGRTHYYVVTSVEHSGLQSVWSAEVAATPPSGVKWRGPIRHFYEAELAEFSSPMLQRRDPANASNLHYLSTSDYLADRLQRSGEALFRLDIPRAGAYRLLVRARVRAEAKSATATLALDGRPAGECEILNGEWQWTVAASKLRLSRGEHVLSWSPADSAFELDCLCLTDDAQYVPSGLGSGDQQPPGQVTGLAATQATQYDVTLHWDALPEPDVSYHNIYASRSPGFTPSQATRVASVYGRGFLDWGLKPGTTYAYRVTAVDRAGNEGAASAEVLVSTQPLTVGQVVIECEAGQLTGQAAVHDEPEASAGKAVWVPELGTTGEYPNLVRGSATGGLAAEFSAPVDARYVIWGRMRSIWANARFDLLIDDQKVGNRPWEINFGYYHEKGYMIWGPRAATSYIYCWCPARTNTCPDPRPFLVELSKGTHRLEVRGIGEGLSVDQLVVTNDLSWRPEPGPLNYY